MSMLAPVPARPLVSRTRWSLQMIPGRMRTSTTTGDYICDGTLPGKIYFWAVFDGRLISPAIYQFARGDDSKMSLEANLKFLFRDDLLSLLQGICTIEQPDTTSIMLRHIDMFIHLILHGTKLNMRVGTRN
jgi:hypothetical protein